MTDQIIDAGKPSPGEAQKRKRELILTIVIAVLFIGTTYFEYRLSHISNRLPFVNSIFFFGLINFNIILLMVLVLLISRNVGKLILERRKKTSGSRLKTKLVVSFLSFTIIPTGILFLISSFYINSSFDKWFSIKILNTLQTSLEITQTYYQNTSKVSQYLAAQISREIEARSPSVQNIQSLKKYIDTLRTKSSVNGIEVYTDSIHERLYSVSQLEEPLKELPRLPMDVLEKSFAGQTVSLVQHIGGADLIRSLAPVKFEHHSREQNGVVAVTFIIPTSLVNRVDAISSVFQDYKDVNPLKYPVKTTYFLILIMMTALIIFVSIWIGLYLARELTVPLDRLVTATQKIRTGDLDFQILNTGNDEIARLTDSFNQMTDELRTHRKELEERNSELNEKTNFVETILNSVAAGVITCDEKSNIVSVNPSAYQLLQIPITKKVIGVSLAEVFPESSMPLVEMYKHFIERKDLLERETLKKQFSVSSSDKDETKNLTATVSKFRNGMVFVIDDSSYIYKAQREAAWREVARRIAHEIKNPLTPIKLSAQRLRKKFQDQTSQDALLLNECTGTIIKNVDELRDMVNEFSNFARFPEINPKPCDLNEALKEVLSLFEQAHKQVEFIYDTEARLPIVECDRDQMKRVIMNLLDNAVAAQPLKIILRTLYNEKLKIAVIEVEDNGSGMNEEVRSRAFEPNFSTKKTGTGLGLAIVKRIISDHSGFIRVWSELKKGTKFTIELPLNAVNHEKVGEV